MERTKNDYSGRVSFYSPFQRLLLFDDFENGKLKANGIVHKKKLKNTGGKVEGCIDWYLITTFYPGDGTKITSEEYLFTTCDDACNTTRIQYGKISCDGGVGGSGVPASGPIFPTYPTNNDIYEFTDGDGKYTQYQFDSQINYWVVTQVILPEILVQSQ